MVGEAPSESHPPGRLPGEAEGDGRSGGSKPLGISSADLRSKRQAKATGGKEQLGRPRWGFESSI